MGAPGLGAALEPGPTRPWEKRRKKLTPLRRRPPRPPPPCCQVGFICFDGAVHFFNLKAGLSAPQMLTVPDLAELFLPLPDDLLVNLAESRDVVDALLDALPNMFAKSR